MSHIFHLIFDFEALWINSNTWIYVFIHGVELSASSDFLWFRCYAFLQNSISNYEHWHSFNWFQLVVSYHLKCSISVQHSDSFIEARKCIQIKIGRFQLLQFIAPYYCATSYQIKGIEWKKLQTEFTFECLNEPSTKTSSIEEFRTAVGYTTKQSTNANEKWKPSHEKSQELQ